MTAPSVPPLRTLRLTAPAWALAVGDDRSDDPDKDPAVELRTAGVMQKSGELDPGWAAVIAEHQESPLRFRITSRYAGLAYVADVVLGDHTTSALLRRLILDGDAAPPEITGADPLMELAVTGPNQPWLLVRRVLPPLDIVRAAPLLTPRGQVTLEQQGDRLTATDAPADIDTLLAGLTPPPDVVAHVSLTVGVQAGGSAGVGLQHWITDGETLWWVHVTDGRPALSRVLPGDIGYQVQWYALGGLDILADHRARETDS